jgi:HPt (histidine-containing phosphotransfer) domain-containing protein
MEEPNFSYINSLSGGDEAFETKLLQIIQMEYPKERDLYLKNISEGNFKEAAENVHKLKHKISILGLEKSYEVASQFENNLKENKDILKEDFSEILSNITRFLKKL